MYRTLEREVDLDVLTFWFNLPLARFVVSQERNSGLCSQINIMMMSIFLVKREKVKFYLFGTKTSEAPTNGLRFILGRFPLHAARSMYTRATK